MNFLKQLNFGFTCKTPELFVTSQWQNSTKPSVKYLIYRWILTSYFNFVLVLSVITAEECRQIKFYAIYLTNWNVMMNAFSSLFGAVLVTLYYRKVILFDDDNREITKMLKTFWLLSTLSTVVSISVSCVYWLSYTGRDKGLNDALTHAGNAIVMLVDVFVVAHPPRYGHFIYPLSFGVFYTYLFSVSYTLLGGTNRDLKNFIYPSLDWKNNTAGALKFATATVIFLTVMHLVLTFLGAARTYIHKWLRRQKSDQSSNLHMNE